MNYIRSVALSEGGEWYEVKTKIGDRRITEDSFVKFTRDQKQYISFYILHPTITGRVQAAAIKFEDGKIWDNQLLINGRNDCWRN